MRTGRMHPCSLRGMAIGEATPGWRALLAAGPPPAGPSGPPALARLFARAARVRRGRARRADVHPPPYGPFVQTRLPLQLYFIADPACIEEILVKKAEAFRKDRTSRLLSRVVGNGLLVNEGDSWRRQRRLLQPAFHQRQLQSYAAVMAGAIARAAASWSPARCATSTRT